MATMKWDHLVHYVNDLAKPVEIFGAHGLVAFKEALIKIGEPIMP